MPGSEEQDGWIPWSGGECPVPPETIVEAKFGPDGAETDVGRAGRWLWSHHLALQVLRAQIIAYRIVEGE
jgi:hypothetical protein